MEFVVGVLALVLTLVVLAVRVSRVASWRSVAMIAAATGSPKACIEFLRYCERLS